MRSIPRLVPLGPKASLRSSYCKLNAGPAAAKGGIKSLYFNLFTKFLGQSSLWLYDSICHYLVSCQQCATLGAASLRIALTHLGTLVVQLLSYFTKISRMRNLSNSKADCSLGSLLILHAICRKQRRRKRLQE